MVYTVHAWCILTYYTVLLMLKSGQLIRFGNVVIVMINADTWVMLRKQIKIQWNLYKRTPLGPSQVSA